MKTKIKVSNLYKSFGSHNVLKGINLEIEQGKSYVILGSSGSGKSVLIKTIIGLLKPKSGTILIDNINPFKIPKAEKSVLLSKCGFLFQSGALFDSLTIEDNITFFAKRLYNLNPKGKRELAIKMLSEVGLDERVLTLYPSELSGGMQKRASLARTIATKPEILFFDEPTTGLDPVMSNVINELIIKIRNNLGATCITITHDMNSARKIGDVLAMINDGKIIWQGTASQIDNSGNPIVHQFINGLTDGPLTD